MSEYEVREPDQLDGIRPPEFTPATVGHAAQRSGLLQQLAAGRLPGGILIHGPRGVGKATLAFDFAREVFAATGDEHPAHIAEQVASGGYPNLRVLRKVARDTGKGFYTGIRVDEVRELVDRLHKTRGRAGHRIAVVDSIDDCNISSSNALLKVLEEPPADTTFLLVSHRPGSLLPTVRSRCHQVALRALSDAETQSVLIEQKPDADPAALQQALHLATGRPRRGFEALQLADGTALGSLGDWLVDPMRAPPAVHLALADVLAADKEGALARFGRDTIRDWLAAEARAAALDRGPRRRLASANELWDKAIALFADTDEYNLDARQTLIVVFDAIRRHVQTTWPAPVEPR